MKETINIQTFAENFYLSNAPTTILNLVYIRAKIRREIILGKISLPSFSAHVVAVQMGEALLSTEDNRLVNESRSKTESRFPGCKVALHCRRSVNKNMFIVSVHFNTVCISLA